MTLDEESIGRSGPDIEHERAIAIYDLVEKNLFAPEGAGDGPFTLHIGITGNRLMFDIRREDGTPVVAHLLSLTPFRRIVKDYFMICDSYYQAIRTATPDKIEAIDMGRRGIHDEGSRTLQERLERQGADRFRNRAPAVHADLRAALEGLDACPTRAVDGHARSRRLSAMTAPPRAALPQAVLFACGLNSVRSPMAGEPAAADRSAHALYVRSAGVQEGRARSVRGRGDGRTRPGHLRATSRPPSRNSTTGKGSIST